jgi:magnesium chelatase family protein
MLVQAHGFAVSRGMVEHVRVELDARGGLPGFSLIGLGAGAARDARERVQAAVLNSGFAFPRKRLTANLAPAAAPKSGPAFDLVLACCVLAVQEQIDPIRLARIGLFAQLGLGGDLRPWPSVALVADAAAAAGLAGLVVADPDLAEARASRALPVVGLHALPDVVALLRARPGVGGSRGARLAALEVP